MKTIDALVCIEPGRLRLEPRPAPRARDAEVLVRPRRIGICGTDYHIFEGTHPFLRYPRVMGHELAVEVVDSPSATMIGPGVVFAVNPYLACGLCIACRQGKPNCCVEVSVLGVHQDGGMAGLLSVPVTNLVPVPGLTVDQACLVEFLAIGAHAVRRAAVATGDRVLVVGAGPIGLGVALFAKLSNATVAVLDREPRRTEIAREIVNVAAFEADDDGMAELLAFTSGEGFDVVFDATGSARAMEGGFDHVAHGGRYVLVSVVKEAIKFRDPDFHRKELTLLGSRNATNEDFQRVIAAIRNGSVPADCLITHRTSLAGASVDIPKWATDKGHLVKAVIEMD